MSFIKTYLLNQKCFFLPIFNSIVLYYRCCYRENGRQILCSTQTEPIEESIVDSIEEIIDEEDPRQSPSAIIVISVSFFYKFKFASCNYCVSNGNIYSIAG